MGYSCKGFAPELVSALGHDQVVDVDSTTWQPRERSWTQLGGFSKPQRDEEFVRLRLANDRHYAFGGVMAPKVLESAAGRCIILAFPGQSNQLGTCGNLGGPLIPQTIFSSQPPRPGIIKCFNGGIAPKQVQQHANNISTPIDPAQYTHFVDAYEGLDPNGVSAKAKESGGIAAALSFASRLDFSRGGIILLINYAHGSAGFAQVTDFVGVDSQVKIDFKVMFLAAKSIAESMGLKAEFGGFIWDGHEGEQSDPISGALTDAAKARLFVDEMKTLIGQTTPVPLLWVQQDHTFKNGSAGSDGIIIPWAYGIEQYCRSGVDPYTSIMPAHWVYGADDEALGAYPSVHRHPMAHYLLKSACGHALFDLGRGKYVPAHFISAEREGKDVFLTPFDEAVFDNFLIKGTVNEGFTFHDSAGDVGVERVGMVDGVVWLRLATTPTSSQELVRMGYNNAILYPGYTYPCYGRGASNGPRATVKSPGPEWFCPGTGVPLFRWNVLQELEVTT